MGVGCALVTGGGVTGLLAFCVLSSSFKMPVSQSGSSPVELAALGCGCELPATVAVFTATVGASGTSSGDICGECACGPLVSKFASGEIPVPAGA